MAHTLLTLSDEQTQLTLAPAAGASLVNWTRLSDGWPLLRYNDEEAIASANPRRLGCYPLLPWSNRISEGGFATPSGWQPLLANTEHPTLSVHGTAWQQPWQIIAAAADNAHLQLDSQSPFPYRADLHVKLRDGRLTLTLQATHMGTTATWYGLGLHPYLTRTAHTQLQASAQGVWLCDDSRLSTQWVAHVDGWDFTEAAALPQELVDNAFTAWPGSARIIQRDAGYQLLCQAQGSEVFLLYCPPGKDFFCFEPVTHPVNAHHLPGRPGLQLLEPGQSCQLQFSLHYQAIAE